MEKRSTIKNIEVNGRKFQIDKLDAMTSCYVASVLMSIALPLIGPMLVNQLPMIPKGLPFLSKEEFFDLQRDLLSACSEILSAGPTPIIGENGRPAVEDLEKNATLVLNLTVTSLVWSVGDFFDASLLKALKESLADISLFKQKTSE